MKVIASLYISKFYSVDVKHHVYLLTRLNFTHHHSLTSSSRLNQTSGAVQESRWPSWAARPNEPSGFRGRKAILTHALALVSACP